MVLRDDGDVQFVVDIGRSYGGPQASQAGADDYYVVSEFLHGFHLFFIIGWRLGKSLTVVL
jgi:hypothetical protein